MKKTYSLLVAIAVTCVAGAQQLHKNSVNHTQRIVRDKSIPASTPQPAQSNAQAKGTAAAFYSEHFDTGLPAGWTVVSVTPVGSASWKWYPNGQISTAPYSIGAINTTTGFMIYDSDSIGGGGIGTTVPVGYMATAAISCTGHASVALTFDEYYRKFQDSCFVEVSTSPAFVTSTRYPVSANNALTTYDYLLTNPFNAFIDISSVAANQSNVYIRFYYYGAPGGGYSWQIDNVALSELDPVNVALHSSFLIADSTFPMPYSSSIGNVPSRFRDSVCPITFLDNHGSLAQNGFTITAKMYKNGVLTSYNQSITVPSLPVGAADSSYKFPHYFPDAIAVAGSVDNYFCAYAVSVAGNVNVDELVDTVRFSVTDTLWSQNISDIEDTMYVHRPIPNEQSIYIGTRFDVPTGDEDTISAVSVCFSSNTTPGSEVQVQIYKLDANQYNGWNVAYATYTHILQASEISTPTTQVYAYIPMDVTAGPAIMDSGTWAAVVTPINVPASNTVMVQVAKPNPATSYAGFFGQEDSSNNDGGFTFGFQTQATGIGAIPMVRLHFGGGPVIGGVWPGDVNYDHVVDNYDGLNILSGFGSTGVTRPGASNTYTGQACTDWGTFIVPTVDMKNADCDGNGTVGYSDTVAIWNNYGLTHPKGVHTAQPKASGLPDLYFDLTAITFNAGTTVHIPIKLGTAIQPMNNMLGIAAQIKVSGIILFNAPTITNTTSWMGNAGNLLNFKKGVNTNQTDWAFGRIDHTNVSGNGTIATLDMDIPFNATGQAVLYFDNVKVIDNAGNVITGYNVLDDTATIIPSGIENITSPVHELAIVPNPSSTQAALQLHLDAATTLHITVTDVVGKTVYDMVKTGKQGMQSFELPVAQLKPGVYTVKLSSETWQGAETLKWIKN